MSVDRKYFETSHSFINRQDRCENTDQKTKDNECSAEKGLHEVYSLNFCCHWKM